ncbi:MAG: FtsW/RodA/SpoVE family cell cycle protein [Alphaproteobacteria bacterium]|nr:FtsW/RodA/SpoVE family cell cycle protein [Alphaproteobacteria bacterium]
MILGIIVSFIATPPVAKTIGLNNYHFIYHQVPFMFLSFLVMIGISFLNQQKILQLTAISTLLLLILMIIAIFFFPEKKGSHRWIYLFGLSLQPSEFIKPCFAIILAHILATKKNDTSFKGFRYAALLYAITVILLIKQPDIGMATTVTIIFISELFLSGVPLKAIVILFILTLLALGCAYFFLEHFKTRIDVFLTSETKEKFQITKALEAIANGNLWGCGLGKGTVKYAIPDAHTDFVLAVIVEECGIPGFLVIISLFIAIIARIIYKILTGNKSLYAMLAICGIITQFAFQTVVNISSTLGLIPTKGMTLPFISYGGSSLLALGFGMGMILGLSKESFSKKGIR